MSELHLNDLSKIYLEQIAEKKDDSYLETDMKKRQANNEKARKEMEKIPGQKNPHFEAADMSGAPSIKDAKPAKKTNVKYDPHMKVMAPQVEKEEVEAVDEAMSSYDRNRKRAAQRAAERNAARAAGKTGVVPGVGYVSPRKERETYVDSSGTTRHKSGAKMEDVEYVDENRAAMGRINKEYHRKKEADEMEARARDPKVKKDLPKRKNDNPMYDAKSAGSSRVKDFKFTKEALDPVGKEDGDVNNDGKKDSSDSYLMKRRAAIAKALGKKKQTEEVENPSRDLKGAVKKAVKRIDHNVSGDVDKNDKSMGNYGEFVPSADGKKKLTTKIGEGYSNWRTDLTEVMDDIESKPIKEKAVKNKVTINPKLSEAVEEIGGQVLEVTEVQEEASMSPQEIQLQKKKAMIDKMIATKRQQGLTKAKKSEEPAKAVGEEMSIKDQMRISQEYNRKSPEEKKAIYKKAVAGIPKGKPKKDTRTDAQKMTDATGPRPGSRYRGD